ncbi:hypothetical protein E1630_08685 [Salmonella enterica subsp. enterica serovar Baguida]|nr:hypothetical protein [Salmonella enterica subsp. enterica serovar Baguida]
MIRHYGLTEKEAANSFTDDELEMMAASGNNPQSNVCKEVLALRAVLQSFVSAEQLIKHLSSNQDSDGKTLVEEIKQPSSKCPKCGGRGNYWCPQMCGPVDCECTLEPVSNRDELPVL